MTPKDISIEAFSSCCRDCCLRVLLLLVGPDPVETKCEQNIHTRRHIDDVNPVYVFPLFMTLHGDAWLTIDQNALVGSINLILQKYAIRRRRLLVDREHCYPSALIANDLRGHHSVR